MRFAVLLAVLVFGLGSFAAKADSCVTFRFSDMDYARTLATLNNGGYRPVIHKHGDQWQGGIEFRGKYFQRRANKFIEFLRWVNAEVSEVSEVEGHLLSYIIFVKRDTCASKMEPSF